MCTGNFEIYSYTVVNLNYIQYLSHVRSFIPFCLVADPDDFFL
jgi:hypothetical protein